jgi:hypothetical protein
VVRTFTWQEKVYSKAELVSAQVRGVEGQDRACDCSVLTAAVMRAPQASLRAQQRQGIPASSLRRAAHFGSQAHVPTADRMLVSESCCSTL